MSQIDIAGAASDLSLVYWNLAKWFGHPEAEKAVRLLARNPWASAAVLQTIEAELEANPDKAVGLDTPLPWTTPGFAA